MLYLAFVMILVGVLCFLYVSFSSSEGGKSTFSNNVNPPQNSSIPGRRRATSLDTHPKDVYHPVEAKIMDSEMEERIRQERSFFHAPESEMSIIYTKPLEEPSSQKPDVVEAVEVVSSPGTEFHPQAESKLKIHGLLYTDSKGKIPFDQKHLKEIPLSDSFFDDLKRIGEGSLNEENGRLIFQVKNQSFTYEPNDLKQIVFLDDAVVFLPSRTDLPSPVFFTDSADELKAFFAQAGQKK